MRILQIAPLFTPTNDYGGPMTVAVGQCRALQDAGHEVLLAGGVRDFTDPPREIGGVRVHCFPAHALVPGSSFGGLVAPRMIPWLTRTIRSADVVHVHLARDLLTLPAARLCAGLGVPFVVQTHGMVVESDNRLAGSLDLLMTRTVMRSAGCVFYLTAAERTSLSRLFPTARLKSLRNGIDLPPVVEPPSCDGLEVLFLARLQGRKRPLDFVSMAVALAAEFPTVRFRLVGPDEGEGAAVQHAIQSAGLGRRLIWDGPVPPDRTSAVMRRAGLYVLPSVDEPYPMTVLEALAHGLPTIVTDTCGLAPLIGSHNAGAVVTAGADSIAAAVRRYLAEEATRITASHSARRLAENELGMAAVVRDLKRTYSDAVLQRHA